jgi:hypothetical protein
MGIDLNAVRNRLKSLQTTTTKRNHLWKPEPGKSRIRIVPYAFNRENPFIEIYFHYNVGKKSYVSLETFGETDPIVEFSEKLKQTGSKEDWTLGKKLEPTLRTFVPVIVRGKEKEGVKFWGFGKNIYQELLAIISDPDYGDISDPTLGRDVEIDYMTPAEAGNTYGKTTIRVKPNQGPCTDDKEVMELIVNGQVDINEVYKKSTYDELHEALEKWLNPDEEEAEVTSGAPEQPTSEMEDKDFPTPTNKSNMPGASNVNKVEDVTKAFDALFQKK